MRGREGGRERESLRRQINAAEDLQRLVQTQKRNTVSRVSVIKYISIKYIY